MSVVALLYHDVVPPGGLSESGFPGAGADCYKLDVDEFERHVAGMARVVNSPAVAADRLAPEGEPFLITFDDGGVSAHTVIAGILEERGWRGNFLVTTDYIGKP